MTQAATDLTHDEMLRYSRHLLLPEVGLAGQARLKAASALVVGVGGLGSPIAMYLAAAGVGRIGLVDHDAVDVSNLQRQVIHGTGTLGERKVDSARRRLLDINPLIRVETFDEPFTAETADRIAGPYDLILDASDNFATRYLVNDVCVLTHKPDVYGSVFQFEGQVSVFWADRGPCYRCLFPTPPPPGSVPSCAEGGVFGVLPGTIGTLQATEALKILLGVGDPLLGRLLLYDGLALSFAEIQLRKNPACVICSAQPQVTGLIDYQAFCGVPAGPATGGTGSAAWEEIEPGDLAARLKQGDSLRLIDVREPHEALISQLPGAEVVPLGQLAARLQEFEPGVAIVVFCRTGTRSVRAAQLLSAAGVHRVMNLAGGINAWAQQVDPRLPVY